MSDWTRRGFLGAVVAVAGGTAFAGSGPRTARATRSNERFVVDAVATDMDAVNDVEVRFDLHDPLGFVVVDGLESELPSDGRYAPDLDLEVELPEAEHTSEEDDPAEPFLALQWDRTEGRAQWARARTTGAGARIAVIDDGVFAGHPDLESNVRTDLSMNFSGDENGSGPLADDHGTHVAGIAAAAENGRGVVGVAPDAEVVDVRVFSGLSGSLAAVSAGLVYAAAVDCDAANLSLGTPPLVPYADDAPDLDPPFQPTPADEFEVLLDLVSAAGEFAVENGCLPVASVGNSAADLDAVPSGADVVPTVLPAEADPYLSVAATGPIGFGWPVGDDGGQVVESLRVETPVRTQLPTFEPANYTNFGSEAVDVSAPGGNFDADAVDADVRYFYDQVLSTVFTPVPKDTPPEERPNIFIPTYGWKAGTSMAAPQVTGLVALLSTRFPEASPNELRRHIERTARQRSVGRKGDTTVPDADLNTSFDGRVDGNDPKSSTSDSDPVPSPVRAYRGEGHIDPFRAVTRPLEKNSDEDDSE